MLVHNPKAIYRQTAECEVVPKGVSMKKQLTALFIIATISLASLAAIHPANAALDSISWLKPVWKNRIGASADPFLGDISVAYVTGSTWMLNIVVTNQEYNSTDPANRIPVTVNVTKAAVWFDWDTFYNTTINTLVKFGNSSVYTISGTTEQTPITANLFTHSYKIFVDFEFWTMKDGENRTVKSFWGPYSGTKFAVLSEEQYDSWQAGQNYQAFKTDVQNTVNKYNESMGLMIQAGQEATAGSNAYNQGDFTDSLSHYNSAMSLLNQSYTIAKSKGMQLDELYLKKAQAELDHANAEIDAIEANATARRIEAQAMANAMMMNSVALIFFGLGFMFFGLAAIVYANKKGPKQPA
jgi:hypothetical protein